MAVDFSRYTAPGLYTESVSGPQVSNRSTAPTAVGIFGTAVGHERRVEALRIDPDVSGQDGMEGAINRTLRESGIDIESVRVINPDSREEYRMGIDYEVQQVGGLSTEDPRQYTYTIVRKVENDPEEDQSRIEPGDTVEVSYRYTDPDYHSARIFYDYDDVVSAYGAPFSDGEDTQITSELTLAARIAFLNNARMIVCVAVDPSEDTPTTQDYIDALDKLRDDPDVSVVVPASGRQSIQSGVVTHVNSQSSSRFERRAVLGRDGANGEVSNSQLMTEAGAISNQRIALVAPSAMNYYAPELDKEITVGSQFLAVAIAAISTTQPTSRPLTRRVINGFEDVKGRATETEKDRMSQSGLMVVEKTRRGTVRVRHGVTTDNESIITREWNIIGQQDTMVYRLREWLDNNSIIGDIIDDVTMVTVKASVDSALQSLVADRIIRNYRDLKVRQLETSPDVIEVRYAWQPSMPLNYIVVRYSMDLSTGETAEIVG